RMPRKIVFENRHGFADTAGGMQCNRIDVCVSRTIGFKLGRAGKLAERLVEPLQSGQCEPERMMQPSIMRGCENRGAQNTLSFAVPSKLSIKVGEVDCRWCILGAEPERSLVFDLGVGRMSAP